MAVVALLLTIIFCCYDTQASNLNDKNNGGLFSSAKMVPLSFPSKEDTLAYVDALKHSNFSQWRSLEEVAKRAGGGSCTGAINTSVLTALYLLGLFNLCAASPASCCVPSLAEDRRRRRSVKSKTFQEDPLLTPNALPPLLNSLTQNLSTLSFDQFKELPQVATANGGKVPVHISVVEQVRKLWDSNPRLLSNLPCTSATEAVRSSFISLSGVASGIILAYSIAQLNHCYPDHQDQNGDMNQIWFFPIPKSTAERPKKHIVESLPPEMPVTGEDERDDNCARASVPMADGSCERLLSSRVCPHMQWVLLNVETRQGECFPRLCGHGKVFVEQDQMCHEVNEPGFCPENQRLYLTSWGETVCDCKDGMFFGRDKKCHRIYEQGYCHRGSVLQFYKPSKSLVCQTDQCKELNNILTPDELPYAQNEDGSCYQFGSTGPCEGQHQFGFDIEDLEPSCVSLEEAGLLHPQTSFQYSHMTFPSFTETGFPHFEVSYMILNGSTWELVMRTIGRQKREIDEEFDNIHQEVIPFIDTREFPQNLEEVASRFEGLETGYEKENIRLSKVVMESNGGSVGMNNISVPTGKEIDLEITPESVPSVEEKSDINVLHELNKMENAQGNNDEESSHFDFNGNKNNDSDATNDKINVPNVQLRIDENGKDIMVKVLKGNSSSCKLHISFYSQMPNASVSYNSTSINILSHPHFSQLFANNKLKNESFQILGALNLNNSSNTEDKNQEREEGSTQKPLNRLNPSFLEKNLKKVFQNRTPDLEIVRPVTSEGSDNNLELKSNNVTVLQFGRRLENGTRDIKMDKQEQVLNEKAVKSQKNSVQFLVFESSTSLEEVKNRTQITEKEDIIKVSQDNLTSEKARISKRKGKRHKYRKRKHGREIRRRKKKRKLKKRLRWKKKKNANNNIGSFQSKKHSEGEKRKRQPKLKKIISQKDSGDKNRFQNQSLPEYLRNRGRRQAGPKKRSKLAPGIINAPLLNQCRTGAKRDYNGYCRLTVIPEDRSTIVRRHAKAKYYKPTPPRLKCKEGKRLDSRGVCRDTYSGLG